MSCWVHVATFLAWERLSSTLSRSLCLAARWCPPRHQPYSCRSTVKVIHCKRHFEEHFKQLWNQGSSAVYCRIFCKIKSAQLIRTRSSVGLNVNFTVNVIFKMTRRSFWRSSCRKRRHKEKFITKYKFTVKSNQCNEGQWDRVTARIIIKDTVWRSLWRSNCEGHVKRSVGYSWPVMSCGSGSSLDNSVNSLFSWPRRCRAASRDFSPPLTSRDFSFLDSTILSAQFSTYLQYFISWVYFLSVNLFITVVTHFYPLIGIQSIR